MCESALKQQLWTEQNPTCFIVLSGTWYHWPYLKRTGTLLITGRKGLKGTKHLISYNFLICVWDQSVLLKFQTFLISSCFYNARHRKVARDVSPWETSMERVSKSQDKKWVLLVFIPHFTKEDVNDYDVPKCARSPGFIIQYLTTDRSKSLRQCRYEAFNTYLCFGRYCIVVLCIYNHSRFVLKSFNLIPWLLSKKSYLVMQQSRATDASVGTAASYLVIKIHQAVFSGLS